jgi:hypothetical protein
MCGTRVVSISMFPSSPSIAISSCCPLAAFAASSLAAHAHAHPHTHSHTHRQTDTQTHTHTHTYKHSQTHTHTHTLTCTHTRTHTHTHTRTHSVHELSRPQRPAIRAQSGDVACNTARPRCSSQAARNVAPRPPLPARTEPANESRRAGAEARRWPSGATQSPAASDAHGSGQGRVRPTRRPCRALPTPAPVRTQRADSGMRGRAGGRKREYLSTHGGRAGGQKRGYLSTQGGRGRAEDLPASSSSMALSRNCSRT